jgi:hypothetical protein
MSGTPLLEFLESSCRGCVESEHLSSQIKLARKTYAYAVAHFSGTNEERWSTWIYPLRRSLHHRSGDVVDGLDSG